MSFIATAWAIELVRSGEVTSVVDSYVLRHLADYADIETTECWPSQNTIAKETNLGISTIKRSLRRLLTMKIIAIKKVNTKRGKENHYYFPALLAKQKDPKFDFVNAKKEKIKNEQCA